MASQNDALEQIISKKLESTIPQVAAQTSGLDTLLNQARTSAYFLEPGTDTQGLPVLTRTDNHGGKSAQRVTTNLSPLEIAPDNDQLKFSGGQSRTFGEGDHTQTEKMTLQATAPLKTANGELRFNLTSTDQIIDNAQQKTLLSSKLDCEVKATYGQPLAGTCHGTVTDQSGKTFTVESRESNGLSNTVVTDGDKQLGFVVAEKFGSSDPLSYSVMASRLKPGQSVRLE